MRRSSSELVGLIVSRSTRQGVVQSLKSTLHLEGTNCPGFRPLEGLNRVQKTLRAEKNTWPPVDPGLVKPAGARKCLQIAFTKSKTLQIQ